MNIFEESEFENKNGTELQKMGNEVMQRFNQKRSYFHQVRNSPFIGKDTWNELNKKLVEFDQNEFRNWNQKWSTVSRQQNKDSMISFFNEGETVFEELDDFVDQVKPEYKHSDSVEGLKEDLINKIDQDINNLSTEIQNQVSSGIQDLIDLKAEYKLQDTFAVSIKEQKNKSRKVKNIFLGLFIGSLFIIPCFLLFTFALESIAKLNLYLQWSLRATISITLGIASVFLFNQYRIYQLINLKYSHLYNFIGGGATFLSELIGLEDTNKREVNRKLASMFIEIDDIMASIRKNKHPSENVSEITDKSIDSISKSIVELSKAANKRST
ncbi:hypothetical protein QYS48_28505 [Marivirga arenosa]|uniref:Uncharacterized protein n=1 Tax=Marivirga arenosa TaxID=3059076 RepID=A0AA51RDK8_9BACT|nr:hypothetical protein [Marivirga sp. ABR2-2]WMN07325.1 hypothetical protein QYS48_28505 [Marivirga sp. ABR2-2]